MKLAKQFGNWLGSWRTFRAAILVLVVGVAADRLAYSAATRSAEVRAGGLRDLRLSVVEAGIMSEVQEKFISNLKVLNGQDKSTSAGNQFDHGNLSAGVGEGLQASDRQAGSDAVPDRDGGVSSGGDGGGAEDN